MKLIIFTIIAALFISPCFAQTEETKSKKVISVCPFQIGEQGRTANFRFSFSYILEIDINGKITKVDELASTKKYKATKFVRDDLFIDCMKKWRLVPAGKYFVSFYVGTNSIERTNGLPQNYMLIMDPNKHSLIIELPLSESDTLRK